MNLPIDEEEARRWFNWHPGVSVTIEALAHTVEHYPRRDRRIALGEFLIQQLENERWRQQPAGPVACLTGRDPDEITEGD